MPVGKQSIHDAQQTERYQRLRYQVDVQKRDLETWESLAKELYLRRLKHTVDNEQRLNELLTLVDNWVRAEEGEYSVYEMNQRKSAAFKELRDRLLGE